MLIKKCCFALLLFMLIVLAVRQAKAHSSLLYLWDDFSLSTRLYISKEDCKNNEESEYYLLNGCPLDIGEVDIQPDISSIFIDGTHYYFHTANIVDTIPFSSERDYFIKSTVIEEIPISYLSAEAEPKEININKGSIIEIIGRIHYSYIIRFDQKAGIIKIAPFSLERIRTPLYGMIKKEEAIQRAVNALSAEYLDFSSEALILESTYVTDMYSPEDSYYIVLAYPVDMWHNVYMVSVCSFSGEILSIGYYDEIRG